MDDLAITLIGGPTAVIEVSGCRLLTDPTFDNPGDYQLPHVTLRKTAAPALTPTEVGRVDAVLLSHDQHADNLDHSGREDVRTASRVFTTAAAAGRLGLDGGGLVPWQQAHLTNVDGRQLTIVATPARHGPAGIEPLAGDVIGFMVCPSDSDPIYVTGDTVWYDGIAEVARRYAPRVVLLFAGAARTRGPFDLTMDCNDALEAANAFASATIVPVHCSGWSHFTQNEHDLEQSFAALGLQSRLRVLAPGTSAQFR